MEPAADGREGLLPRKLGGTSIVSVVSTCSFFVPDAGSSWATCRTPLVLAAAACVRGHRPASGNSATSISGSGSKPGMFCSDALERMEAPSRDSNFTTNCTLRRTPPTSSQGSQILYECPSSDSL
ncbi:MAG: hypothetical protein U9N87_15030 [Planctomycetota bacterium]|nr:hypothetical protein [Planctomycetota bacterium]